MECSKEYVEAIYLESELAETTHEDWVHYRSVDKGGKIE